MVIKELNLGNIIWSYGVEEFYTNIFDEDGDLCLQLNWKATEKEALAAAEGMRKGLVRGKAWGEASKLAQIQQALGIPKPRDPTESYED